MSWIPAPRAVLTVVVHVYYAACRYRFQKASASGAGELTTAVVNRLQICNGLREEACPVRILWVTNRLTMHRDARRSHLVRGALLP